jgi:hypothetical protein
VGPEIRKFSQGRVQNFGRFTPDDDWVIAAASHAGFGPAVIYCAAFFVGGDKQTAAELAQMKGQMIAIEQASTAKKCGIQFQGKPEGS